MKWLKILSVALVSLTVIVLAYVRFVAAPQTDAKLNPVLNHAPYEISAAAQTLHDSLTIADLHGDALLWARNPARRHAHGQMDLPRLREGGVDIQVFSVVTKSPAGLNFDGNSADAPDDITKLALAQLWPLRAVNSIYGRAEFQAWRLRKLERNPKNNLMIVRSRSDLDQPDGTLLALLATEGSHPLEGELSNVNRLYAQGYRMMGLQHFFDNELGGSLHGIKKGGLTPFGKQAVKRMRDLSIIVDLAHSSPAVVNDVLNMSNDPVIISHGGLASHCPRTANRNLPDATLKEIAKRGGLIGIGYFNGAICDISPAGIADTILAAVDLMGENAVALGSDFDGSVATSLDTSELAAITQALMDRGVSEAVIRKVMGENVQRFLQDNLPEIQK